MMGHRSWRPRLSALGLWRDCRAGSNTEIPSHRDLRLQRHEATVTNLVKTVSKELAPNNIRVNSVSRGPVSTGLWTEEGSTADGSPRPAAGPQTSSSSSPATTPETRPDPTTA